MVCRLAALGLVLSTACGTEPVDVPVQMEPPVEPPSSLPPPVQPNERVSVSGNVVQLDRYLRGETVGVEGASIGALGVYGVRPETSAADGSYRVSVPQNGQLILEIQKEQYLPSYEAVAIGDRAIEGKTTYLAPETYVRAIAGAVGVALEEASYGVVIGRLVDDGTEQSGVPAPVAGASAGDFTIEGASVRGPYFLAADGSPGAGLTETVREVGAGDRLRGGLFAVFAELGVASIDLKVTVERAAADGTTYQYGPTEVKVFRDALSWAVVPETGRNAAPPPPPQVVDVDFDSQIYPLFLAVPDGGLGCQGCHTSAGGATPAAGMDLYGPDTAHASLDPLAYPRRVNLAQPEASYLLTKPLYEASGVQDHPIIAFLGANDPAYQLILAWIREGAQRGNVVLEPVSFSRDIRPLLYAPYQEGGIGCFGCHVDGSTSRSNAPGKLWMGGDAEALFIELTEQRAEDNGATGEPYRVNRFGYPAKSLLLTNPLAGNPEPHPVKLFFGADDARYQLIYRWISEGYLNDGPP